MLTHSGIALHRRACSPNPSNVEDGTRILADSVVKLSSLIEEQISLLRRNDQRKEAADKSRQPIPEVPATSSSAWNALLRSTLSDAIQPRAEGWRSGLDALLVFLGLFSAIVTAFIIQSLVTLKQDEIARTNEILSNITNIILAISGTNITQLNLPQPAVFVPQASDVRLNVYLTLSLIISLSIGALAIACRGFLNLVAWSQHNKAVERLTDITTRWKAAEKRLGPAIESLPQLLILPVLLFILGLLDSLFSVALQLSSPPVSIIVTSAVSVAIVAAVAGLMGFTLVEGSLHPTTSPFQSRLAHVLNGSLVQHIRPIVLRLRKKAFTTFLNQPDPSPPLAPTPPLSAEAMNIYHEILQATGDDDILDEASAALFHVIAQRTANQPVSRRFFRRIPIDLMAQECATLLHLLSPEASVRSNRTAAQVIVDMATTARARPLRYSQNDMGRLLPSLSKAARRAATGTSSADLWDSEFLRAMAIVANTGTSSTRFPPAAVFLDTDHWSWKYLAPSELSEIFTFLFEVIEQKISEALADAAADEPDATETSIVDAVLSEQDPTSANDRVAVNPRNILAALLYLPHDTHQLMGILVAWLLRTVPPHRVLSDAHEHIHTIQRSDWLHLLGHQ
ncbi:hypothetical protein FB451DRAFT_616876 [Mycena latifolia]|nr:hypothetical protein FB451DRAFT_616876 [Mycena latifolia]